MLDSITDVKWHDTQMSTPRIIIDSIDADGCVYNFNYHYLVLWLMAERGHEITQLYVERAKEKASGVTNPEITASIQRIIHDMRQINLSAVTDEQYSALLKKLLATGTALLHCETKNTDGLSVHDLEADYYIGIMNALDENLLHSAFLLANQPLLDRITTHVDPHKVHEIALASLRQAYPYDLIGVKQNHTNFIFKDLFHLTKYLRDKNKNPHVSVILNPITLTDVAAGLPIGESYRRIIVELDQKHESYFCDISKFAIIYAKAHDAAIRYLKVKSDVSEAIASDGSVTINFYENEPEIINNLVATLREFPELLPKGVRVVFHPYDGKFFAESAVINGQGLIDDDYRNNVRFIISLAQLTRPRESSDYVNVVKEVDMLVFQANRILAAPNQILAVMLDADGCVYNKLYRLIIMRLVKHHGVELRDYARNIHDQAETEKFAEKLVEEILSYDLDKFDINEYNSLVAELDNMPVETCIDDDLNLQMNTHTASPHAFMMRQCMRYLDEIHADLMSVILCYANRKMFLRIMRRAEEEGCRRIKFVVGSNRQCASSDAHNSINNGTGLFHHDLARITNFLGQQFEGQFAFELEKILMADVYANLAPGTSYQYALSNQHDHPHAIAVFDITKASQIYLHLHHLKRQHPDITALEFYDDRGDIFDAVMKAYGADDVYGMLPRGLTVNLVECDGTYGVAPPTRVIRGSGELDVMVYRSVQLMASMVDVNLEAAKQKQVKVNIADELDFDLFIHERNRLKSRAEIEFDELVGKPAIVSSHCHRLGLFAKPSLSPEVPTEIAEVKAVSRMT